MQTSGKMCSPVVTSDPRANCVAVHADLTLAMIPRSVTMALALPIAHQLHASAGITALGVMLTGHSLTEPAY